jgi:Ca2+-binding RTX toxin-like protein
VIYDPLVRVTFGALLVAGMVAVAAPVIAQVRDGGPGSDTLKGTAKADQLSGRGGADTLKGRGGDDKLSGGAGDDELNGSKGKDRISGGGASDVLIGGKGNDTLNPGKGEDQVNMREGVELAAPGKDVIRARDGSRDQISCGDGIDKVFVDAEEEGVYDCETVVEPPGEGTR